MNTSLRELLIKNNKKLPKALIKLSNYSEAELIQLKNTEIEYMEFLKSRLNELILTSSITDQTTKLVVEQRINSNASYYIFRHQLGTFRHRNKIKCVEEYVPLTVK